MQYEQLKIYKIVQKYLLICNTCKSEHTYTTIDDDSIVENQSVLFCLVLTIK